jgi:hypothetical protein
MERDPSIDRLLASAGWINGLLLAGYAATGTVVPKRQAWLFGNISHRTL